MAQFIEFDDLPIIFWAKYREYGMQYLDGGSAMQMIHYCPWCGSKLPESLRDEWFDVICDRMQLESDDPNIPEEYLSDKWYQKNS